MAESSKEDKIIRTSLESLVIFVSNDELKYREKYLPDPRHLSDDKIVCTVCSTSLASRVRKGKNIYIHSILGVLVCKKCQNFYGDGIFSTDEDGEDKYCRWCGQGGTLYLCSKCNCGFCKKCMTKNMKNTALAGIEKDDWKCLICVPRPIFGSRAVCWASQELNSTIRKKELVKLRLEEAKLKLEAENDIHTNEKECNRSSVKKDRKSTKRRLVSEDSDSSSVFIPSKKFKRDTKNDKSLNGSVKKHRRKYLSSDSDSSNIISTSNKAKGNSRNKKKHESSSSESDNVHSSKVKKHKNKNKCQSSGSESNTSHTSKELKLKYKNGGKCESSDSQDGSPSSSKRKKNKRFSKKASKTSSDESSDSDGAVDKSHSSSKKRVKSYKTKSKYKVSKRKAEAQSDPSSSESKEKLRKKKKKHIEQKSSSDVPLEDDNNVKEHDIVLLKDNVTFDDNLETSSNSKNTLEKIEVGEDELNSVTNLLSKTGGNESANLVLVEEENTSLKKGNENSNETLTNEKQVSEIEVQINEDLTTLNNTAEPVNDETSALGPEMSLLNENDYTLSYNGSESTSDDKIPLSQDDEIKVKVDLAREWLIEVNSDIASLGNFVSDLATTKFGKRGVKLNDFDSYGDVLLTINRLKRLFEGIHTNYKNIEDGLEDKFKSWKILAGLEKSDLEDQAYDENEEIQAEDVAPTGDGERKDNINTEVDVSQFQGEDQCSLAIKVENEICSENESAMHKVNHSGELLTDVSGENNLCDETEDFTIKEEVLDIVDKETVAKEEESYLLKNSETLAETVEENETSLAQEPENEEVQTEKEEVDNDLVKVESKLRRVNSNLIWKGLLSTDDESDFYDEINLNTHRDIDDEKSASDIEQGLHLNEVEEHQVIDGEAAESNKDIDEEELTKEPVNEMDAENFEALQELLYTSTEPDIGSSENDSDDSSDIQLDDSDLENILKPKKVILKKSSKKKEPKETKVIEKVNEKLESESDEVIKNQVLEEKSQEKKLEEPLDSEAEIDMLTDLTKLKKKTVLRRVEEKDDSSGQSSSEASQISDHNKDTKKRKKYNREIKKKREQERNELFGFLDGGSSAEDDADITRDDLDVMEEHYASESSESMSLEVFSRRMNEKYRELEKEQDQLNLQLLLASESEGYVGGDDFVLDSDEDKKKKGKKKKEAKSIKVDEAHVEKADTEKDDTDKDGSKKDDMDKDDSEKDDMDKDGSEKDDMDKDGSEDNEKGIVKEEKEGEEAERDQDYDQFLEGMANSKTTFTGLGSSSEEDKEEDGIKEELLSDEDSKVKKQSKASDDNDEDSSNSDSSADLFLDTTKKKSEKKSWRQHKLLKIKLSDTDTSDEERWWQRRIERDKKKKQEGNSDGSEFDEFTQALSPKKPREKTKKAENGSDKENKRMMKKEKRRKEEEESGSSSTLEMSSTDSSGSETFKKKKKKKNESSDSDIQIISDTDKKKKKKKKKMNLSGNSSDESGDSDDDVIDITQKNSQGESPGKGGRKNIRKVMTKHELAAATKAAAREEEERKKRIAARQKMFNEMFEIKEAEILQKLVLDFDPETKTELISVDKDLVTKMKPHQAKGVQFMWNSCFESLNQMKTKKGSGCILAHCMGLGKTFQVVSLVHTILTHKDTNVRTVLVVCPLSTVLNWYNEFDKWLEDVAGGKNIRIYHLTKFKRAHERSKQLSVWHRTGGVMILGYEMFRILANPNNKNFRLMHTEMFQKTLIDPGADLVVCDEGHMLKNESTLLSKAMSRIRTLRRIVLTGTPMQNNLKEYHCMVQFVKPNLLGTRKEFLNQFVNPITNGQFVDSTEADVKVMKRRAHVLHKMLEGLVQRFDYNVLTPFLPPKHEFVISLKLSDVQVKLYQFYLDYFCQKGSDDKRTSAQLFQDWQVLGRIWTHPRVLKMSFDKSEKERKKHESEDEGSIKNFIHDKSSSSSLSLSSSASSDDENGEKKDKTKKKEKKDKKDKGSEKKDSPLLRALVMQPVDEINLISSEEEDGDKNEEVKELKENHNSDKNKGNEDKVNDSGIEELEKNDESNSAEGKIIETEIDDKKETKEDKNEEDKGEKNEEDKGEKKEENKKEESGKEKKNKVVELLDRRGAWWKHIIDPEHFGDINQSSKLVVLFSILRECEMIEDKVLVFSQSLFSLDLIEYFLKKVDKATEENRLDESLGNHAGCWQKGLDYFRLDGSSSSENRSSWCKSFNRDDNPRARLFLISTRAGGLGINLTGANRVVIFDASWNPSHDIQSIFRIYRFGQKKPCYIYRFVAHGTMEEKVYDRQVAKQLLSSRVVDEQQVQRHFSMSDLNELYRFTPPQPDADKPTPVLPKDRLMAELLTQHNDWIEKYHEHDSLLENIAEEELNEEERQLAWEDYENEKKRGFMPQPQGGQGGAVPNYSTMAIQIQQFRSSLQYKNRSSDEKCTSEESRKAPEPQKTGYSGGQNKSSEMQCKTSLPVRLKQIYPNIGFNFQEHNRENVKNDQIFSQYPDRLTHSQRKELPSGDPISYSFQTSYDVFDASCSKHNFPNAQRNVSDENSLYNTKENNEVTFTDESKKEPLIKTKFEEKSVNTFEALGDEGKYLFTKTSEVAQRLGYNFVWVKRNKVFVRRKIGAPELCIEAAEDLEKFEMRRKLTGIEKWY